MTISEEAIDLQKFFSGEPPRSCGAMASFTGIVRDHDHGRAVTSLYYDCYRSMAERMINALIEEAKARWGVERVQVSHRVGHLEIGEVAVVISVSSAHRTEAFEACRFMIEAIKEKVPIWKKEIFEDGMSEWVSCPHAAVSS